MAKHPDHANVFCRCFGPCPLCDAEEIAAAAAAAPPFETPKTMTLPRVAVPFPPLDIAAIVGVNPMTGTR